MSENTSQWQPIETAPKDGTYVILYYPEVKRSFVGSYYKREVYDHGELTDKSEGWNADISIYHFHRSTEPTHWMRIPEYPVS